MLKSSARLADGVEKKELYSFILQQKTLGVT